ncbi:hypothetical protein Emin_0556 [Elusimicrobium minutum Pei191]|uniref:Uncharacterized protein n=1 Tax=Elusimicrobium minutum (strain Pei191) TaxID=445932 RepID=B2KCJ0_ELUMP|nr:hypothetical protein [Elusimicrobium minutum]ACC98111.1 hypothetical protein Emin_0556 [Elusimicrobium minutum Pei191]
MKKIILFVVSIFAFNAFSFAQSDADNVFNLRKALSNVLLSLGHSDTNKGGAGLLGKSEICNVALVSQSCVVLPKNCNPSHTKPNSYRFVDAVYTFNKVEDGKVKSVKVLRDYQNYWHTGQITPVEEGDKNFEYLVMNLQAKDKGSVPNAPVKIMVFNDDSRKDAFLKNYAGEVSEKEYGVTIKGKNNEVVIVALNTYEKGSAKNKYKVSHVSKALAYKLQENCGVKLVGTSLNEVKVVTEDYKNYYMADPKTGKKVLAQNEEYDKYKNDITLDVDRLIS